MDTREVAVRPFWIDYLVTVALYIVRYGSIGAVLHLITPLYVLGLAGRWLRS